MNSPFSRTGAPRTGLSALCLSLPLSLTQTASNPIAGECCSADGLVTPPALVVQSSGAILADLNAFRALLGNPNNGGLVGQQDQGHREINWDAVPPALSDVFNFPADFFNNNSPRGLLYESKLRGLEVSSHSFTDINATYAAEFTPFSGGRMFSPLGTNESDVSFFVAGTASAAGVRGFGVVFLDVDKPGSTGLEVFGANGELLAAVRAPVRSDARGASFVGVIFAEPIITRVTIIAGDGLLAPRELDISQGGRHDIVVMDDFIYGEPTARE